MTNPVVKLGQGDYAREWPPRKFIEEPAETYHEKAKVFLSSHALRDFRKSPRLFRRKEMGLIPQRDSSAFALGRAAHVLTLEGRKAFEAQFAVGGPINEKTGKPFGSNTKAFAEWAEQQGKPVLSDDDAATVECINAAVHDHEEAAKLLADGIPEAVLRTELHHVPAQIRMDWISLDHGLVDLKTCANLDDFEADFRRYDYAHQLAFYHEVYEIEIGEWMKVHVIAVEKSEPFRVGVFLIDDVALFEARRNNCRAIAELQRCRANNHWPTRYEEVRTIRHI